MIKDFNLKNEEGSKKTLTIIIIAVIVVFIGVGAFFVLKAVSYRMLEKNMTNLVDKYYNEKIKGKVIGINKQIVTIQALEKSGYDIDKLKDPKSKKACNKDDSYSIINIENPNEKKKSKLKYSIENHLVCGKYKSDKK